MERKLRELIGTSNVWLLVQSSNGWLQNVEILDVDSDMVTFRYQYESSTEVKVWEKTTRISNILEIDVKVTTIPRDSERLDDVRNRLTRLLEQE